MTTLHAYKARAVKKKGSNPICRESMKSSFRENLVTEAFFIRNESFYSTDSEFDENLMIIDNLAKRSVSHILRRHVRAKIF